MTLTQRFDELTDMIFASCVSLKADIDNTYKKRNERINHIKNTYKETSEDYKKEIEKAKQDAANELAEMKVGYSKDIIKLSDVVQKELAGLITQVNVENLKELKAVADVPLTTAEIETLNAKYNNDYWCSRLLSEVAQKNGVIVTEIMPSYDVRMDILNQCINQFNEFVKHYEPSVSGRMKTAEQLQIEVGVSSDVMNRAKALFRGQTNNISDRDVISRSLASLMSAKTDIEKGLVAGNILKNVKKQAIKDKLLCEISLDENISDLAIELSGFSNEINSFKDGQAKLYKSAENAIKEVANTKDKQLIEMRIEENKLNDYFVSMMNSESQRNNTVKEVWTNRTIQEME